MGISGLLPLLKEIQQPRNISDFKDKRLAVDAYVWLHKGAFGCAEELVKGRRTTKFVDYAMYRVRMLRYHGITPYVVFDGGPLPAKRGTEDSRARSRADHLARAQALEAQGRMKDARDAYTKCVDITPEMAYQLIKALRAENVDYVVAPYEADAQLFYLEREGIVDGVITEDSDLLVFGCKTVIFKLEKDGSCVSIDRNKFAEVRELPLINWTPLQFRRMAMLSGCDYLPSIPGIGLKKAHRMLKRFKTVDKLLKSIRLEGSHVIPPNYAADFELAEMAFLYQRVFDPDQRKLVMLSDPGRLLETDEEKWIGQHVDDEIAQGMARGDLHPETREPINDLWPNFNPSPRKGGKAGPIFRGTLDSFITRTPIKRTKSTPAIAPSAPRIGSLANGPQRLSGLPSASPSRLPKYHTEPAPISPPHAAVKTSKFFSKARVIIEEEDEPAGPIDLTWEESTVVGSQSQSQPRRCLTPEPVGTPSERCNSVSPAPSVMPSPRRYAPCDDDDEYDCDRFTSPVSIHSGFSTPRGSSARKILDEETQEPTRPEPSSPTPTYRMRSSQCSATATIALSQRSDDTEIYDEDDYPYRAPNLRPISTVLVPTSSPAFRPHISPCARPSSDSAPDDDIVTPSPGIGIKRRARPRESEEVDEEDRARKVRAAERGVSLSERFSFHNTASYTSPRWIGKRPSGSSIPVTSVPKVLGARPVNVPREGGVTLPYKPSAQPVANKPWPQYSKADTTSVGRSRAAASPVSAPKPKNTPQPLGVSSAQLEAFRYKRR